MRTFLCLLFLLVPLRAISDSKPQNHPLIDPYKGSKLVDSSMTEFDAINFPLEPNHGPKSKVLSLEGKITRLSYENPPQRSTLEVARNYQQALAKNGFSTELSLNGESQIGSGHTLVGSLGLNQLTFCYSPAAEKVRYLITKKSKGDVSTHVILFVAPCKPDKTVLWIVESRPMESDQVGVNAAALKEALDREGHVALYGIQFDFDRADVKPESVPVLKEIAVLLRANPKLSLFVVGHTDQEGELQYNLDLSKRRASSVTNWLVSNEKIAGNRLSGHGMGPLAPVSTNRTDEGRAKNRRVELIERVR